MSQETLTMASPVEKVLAFVKEQYFQPDAINRYLQTHRTGLSIDQVLQEFPIFLESQLVTDWFKSYWKRETNVHDWPGRTVKEALSETIQHTFHFLHQATQSYDRSKRGKDYLEEKSPQEIETIKKYSRLAVDIYRDSEKTDQ
ncbi:MAG: hypothetical protein UV61_C0002G0041 [Candidatus Gottesmanbacteria bacterium GW2011_GWB1_43_11]|uniref:Uncharacterized protein n=1 Tax=Candidatus Gottesmanbacteria bacterium GW2011_GWB1_43_11 TaxID=1618446 RepID=A0A0G1CNH7_9BACT|nr:MAG: hypothetical protein UV55_C0016G0039 [Candidatus Gottesmanbacteria bacterium GW2011_GWC1_43_10]KKS87320.1 MAG: hypothetical protein UV61_C0002G0041 [Candidatus Gottesmanbacteria bacterium GW2011_GWB1_43_11]